MPFAEFVQHLIDVTGTVARNSGGMACSRFGTNCSQVCSGIAAHGSATRMPGGELLLTGFRQFLLSGFGS